MNIRIVLKRETVYKNGRSPLYLRLTYRRRSRFRSLRVSLLPEEWDRDTQKVLSTNSDYAILNSKIHKELNKYKKKIHKLEILDMPVNFDTLLGKQSKRINCTVEEFFNQRVEQLRKEGKVGTASKYYYCLRLLGQSDSVDIRFDNIDLNYLKTFENFLVEKGNKSNSIATKFSVFKALYNRAIYEGVFRPKDNPFDRFKIGKFWKPTRKRAITKEEIVRLKEMELPDTNSWYTEFARDIFLFSYYTAGMNVKDIATMRHSDIDKDRVYYSRHKTDKQMSCYLIPKAKLLIEKYASPFYDDEDYVFPILHRDRHRSAQQIYNRIHKVTGNVNRELGRLSEILGFNPPITTYVARHTFATVLKRSGVDIAIISESLGHSDLSTTEIYLDSFDDSQIDEAMKNLL